MTRLRQLRKSKYTQAEIAKLLGVGRTTYTKYESGDIQMTEETIRRIADIFSVSVDYLMGRIDTIIPTPEDALTETEFALNREIHDLTEAEKQDVLAYIRFRKLQRKQDN